MQISKLIAVAIVMCVAVGIVVTVNAGGAPQAQEVRMLERRLALLEQRLYSIESSINRLEQSVLSQRSQPNNRDSEMGTIREELQNLRLRVKDTECGLLRLDERTATRKSTTKPGDPCRLNSTAPLQLEARP